MHKRIIAATAFALSIVAVVPSAALADENHRLVAVPVSVDFGDYDPAHEALQNAIFHQLTKSPFVTPNVDAYRALRVAVRMTRIKGNRQFVEVTYSWDRKIIRRTILPCSRAQIRGCSTSIVSGAERASHTVRRSPSWLR